jgi:4'-phosphopantetheinyl transferase
VRLALVVDRYAVWFVRSVGELSTDYLSLLSSQERDRIGRLLRPEDQRSYGTAHASLRLILGGILGLSPREVEFVSGTSGKPVLSQRAARAGLDFSISHTREASAIAVSSIGPVGVDIEFCRPIHQPIQLASKLFGNDVALRLASNSLGNRDRQFIEVFTAAEAFLKATERVVLENGQFPVQFEVGDVPLKFDRRIRSSWQLIRLDLTDAYCGAMVVPSSHDAYQPKTLTPTMVCFDLLASLLG